MIKKRAMAHDKWVSEMAIEWIDNINVKRLETGYADNQPKYPYWVKPHNYDAREWDEISIWMVNTFGDSNWGVLPSSRWVGSNRKYWFRDEADRTFFILRWS
jgi:hypothetical protein